MNNSFNEEFYKKKAQKYYTKYIQLKKMKGGDPIVPSWYDEKIRLVNILYNSLSDIIGRNTLIITGSWAVAIYLIYLNNKYFGKFNNLIDILPEPNDVDFLYYSKENISPKNILDYKKFQQTIVKSSTFINCSKEIKSFDLTKTNNVLYFEINEMNILNMKTLLNYYKDNEELIKGTIEKEKTHNKILILEILMQYIKDDEYKNINSLPLETPKTPITPPRQLIFSTPETPPRQLFFETPTKGTQKYLKISEPQIKEEFLSYDIIFK